MDNKPVIFENQPIRRIYDKKKDKWYFSVVDIISILTSSVDSSAYWRKLKQRLLEEGGDETVTNCHTLKMKAVDEKMRFTDVADTETLFRLIQSIPSKRAEPVKRWLARVGYERVEEINNPEKALNRSRDYWQKMGRSEKWIQQRMMGQETRNKLTDYWKTHEVTKEQEYAILTNIIHQEWTGLSVKEHKNLKNIKAQNLRDHMTDAELIFTALAELSTRQIAQSTNVEGFEPNKIPARKGGRIAKNARLELESKTGTKIVSGKNFLPNNLRKIKSQ